MTSLWMVRTERKKVWSCNKFKKMKCPRNRWVLVRNPDTSKEIVQYVHEVRPVFAVTLSTLLHTLVEKGAFTPVGKGLLSQFSNRD